MKKKILVANWKMNKDRKSSLRYYEELHTLNLSKSPDIEIVIVPPFPFITEIQSQYLSTKHKYISNLDQNTKTNDFNHKLTNLSIGAQNCHFEEFGSYTGEVSAKMLKSINVKYIIIGHSERRKIFHESDLEIAKKVKAVLSEGMKPIFCCGEPLHTREVNGHINFIVNQVQYCLEFLDKYSFSTEILSNLIIAYEPIWAIGSNKTPTKTEIEEIHEAIYKCLTLYSEDLANRIPIIYGGNLNPSNANYIFSCKNIDGGLVGRASLDSKAFNEITNILSNRQSS